MTLDKLAKTAGVPEILPYLKGCPSSVIKGIERDLHDLAALQAHPSKGYATFVRAQILGSIAEDIYPHSSADFIKMHVLYRVSFYVRNTEDLTEVSEEFKVLSALWDFTERIGHEDRYEFIEEIVADWDWYYLKGEFLMLDVSDSAISEVAGRALFYKETGRMDGHVSALRARQFFRW
mgnify:CR=1 FL=1